MITRIKVWRKILGAIFDKSFAKREKRRIQQSYVSPVVAGFSRDSFRYYENGRSVIIRGELMSGSTGIDRIIYRRCPMKWSDTGQSLTEAEREKVFRAVGEYLDKGKVLWEFSDATAKSWK